MDNSLGPRIEKTVTICLRGFFETDSIFGEPNLLFSHKYQGNIIEFWNKEKK